MLHDCIIRVLHKGFPIHIHIILSVQSTAVQCSVPYFCPQCMSTGGDGGGERIRGDSVSHLTSDTSPQHGDMSRNTGVYCLDMNMLTYEQGQGIAVAALVCRYRVSPGRGFISGDH